MDSDKDNSSKRFFEQKIKTLENISLPHIYNGENIPEWQKRLWVETIQRNAKDAWAYEKIVKEYINIREKYYDLNEKFENLKDIGTKYNKMEETLADMKKINRELKAENECLQTDNKEKTLQFDKLKNENTNLIESLLQANEKEVELQNKIIELES